MGIYMNRACNRDTLRSKIALESHKQNKKRFIKVEQEGKDLCTYLVDENGHKFLLRKVPIFQIEEMNSENAIKSEQKPTCDYNVVRNARTTFESKQLINLGVASEINLEETMDILKEIVGIPNKSRSLIDL